jgi:hypothetical protein
MSSNLDVGPFGGGNTAYFQDVKASGINGQGLNINGQVIQFNTEVIGKSFITLSSNQFINPSAGDYIVEYSASLRSATLEYGSIYLYDTNAGQSIGGGNFVSVAGDIDQLLKNTTRFPVQLSGSEVLELRIACLSTFSFSQKSAANGDDEYYQQISFTKVG